MRRLADDATHPDRDPRVVLLEAVRLEAWSRHRSARREWLADHRVPRSDQCHVLPTRGAPGFDGRSAEYLVAGGFTAAEAEHDGTNWRRRMR